MASQLYFLGICLKSVLIGTVNGSRHADAMRMRMQIAFVYQQAEKGGVLTRKIKNLLLRVGNFLGDSTLWDRKDLVHGLAGQLNLAANHFFPEELDEHLEPLSTEIVVESEVEPEFPRPPTPMYKEVEPARSASPPASALNLIRETIVGARAVS